MFSAAFHIWHKACIAVLSIHQRITKPFRQGVPLPSLVHSIQSQTNPRLPVMPKPNPLSTVKYYLPILRKEQEAIHEAGRKKQQVLFANTFAAILVFLLTLAIINYLGFTPELNQEINSLVNR
tara:strand:+ start:1958 stop:2326 length:369 start_codon:yes stop_codon:yes gene_type:complete